MGLLFLAAFLLARRRARMAVWIGAVLAANALLLALALSVGRQLFINELAGTDFGPASQVFFDTLLSYLERGQDVVLWLGVIVVVAGLFAGANRYGTASAPRLGRSGGDRRQGRRHRIRPDRRGRPLGGSQRGMAAGGRHRRRCGRPALGQQRLPGPAVVVPGAGAGSAGLPPGPRRSRPRARTGGLSESRPGRDVARRSRPATAGATRTHTAAQPQPLPHERGIKDQPN